MRISARSVARTTVVAVMTAFIALILGVTQTLTTAFVLTAVPITRALIVPGTGTPMPAQDYMDNAVDYYLVPGGDCADNTQANCTTVPVDYIAQFWPIPLPGWGGLQGAKWNVSVQSGVDSLTGEFDEVLDDPTDPNIAIFGYSQGATVATNFKRDHASDPDAIKARTNYFFIGDPQRPDGGFFERFAILGNVPILDAQFGDPAPTDTCTDAAGGPRVCATDFALMYDGVVDFPEWILNPLSFVNAVAGFQYVHGTYLAPNGDDPPTETPYGYTALEVQEAIEAAEAGCSAATYCQVHGDTRYITLPARVLPIYQLPLDIAGGDRHLSVGDTDCRPAPAGDADAHRNRLHPRRLRSSVAGDAPAAVQPDSGRDGSGQRHPGRHQQRAYPGPPAAATACRNGP